MISTTRLLDLYLAAPRVHTPQGATGSNGNRRPALPPRRRDGFLSLLPPLRRGPVRPGHLREFYQWRRGDGV